MPARVPHTEYSITEHWDVIKAVTGIDVGPYSPDEVKQRGALALMEAWNFDFRWATLIGGDELAACHTDMGHAEYAAGGVDRRDTVTCPFSTVGEVLAFDPWITYGTRNQAELTRRFEEHYRRQRAETPEQVVMTGIYVTLMSGLIDIFGWEMLLLAAGMDPQGFGEVANRYTTWIQQYFNALGAADVPVVMVHDDIVWSAGPFISPHWYRRYVFPNYKKLFAPLLDSGKKIMYTSDGNYTKFVADIAACGVHGFVLEPWTDMAVIAETYGRTHAFIGNADTRILLQGDKAAIRAEVERCMAIGKPCPGFFLAVGNHIPPNTPVESVLYYEAVYEELSRR
ncbi:MAG TPA: uroporphyrinogen decarboxylase family protein [Anaerolineae bacterium]|nr:uroporphyrinogen decarboxylase family protein [Anaerolineae bacterium]HQH39073.1 uroporphyrinogen decarboxylase family protein [Anaerolineae bacterium]